MRSTIPREIIETSVAKHKSFLLLNNIILDNIRVQELDMIMRLI